ncbi:MAG: HPr kinase/phosphatase C-terminal domain-containing protein [Alphaproteobacteria bacterium]|nr:HPr kinase/phosphatase C-terminal domain-containing protein [Alphaproteobacteria bacterium]MBU0794597.1 HPr kinase/phosphatase C-terminal domain-containing protein [Alphaproteobacteria bacterium]MBU0876859.1 HPr kinase/phosphatase C-terminal domain-containing protein [Alphaproteobacteria bacterium]MBU1770426.1 HPr kinase/phosphatase C-terminal domain-containing protein [Alphaproteobacteria bacterium]
MTSPALPTAETIHATSVAINGQGVVIIGPSGSGKSDLALRLIDRGAVLISDDYTRASNRDGLLLLDAPENIAGKMEIRHLGIVETPHVGGVVARLAIRLDEAPPRMPDSSSIICLAGIDLPLIVLAGLEPSAPIKVEWALRSLGRRAKG